MQKINYEADGRIEILLSEESSWQLFDTISKIAGGVGALTGAQGKKGKTTTSERMEIMQVSSNLNFTNNLNIQSASDVNITASNLTADNATILTGKFRDEGIDISVNSDAKLMINSAFNASQTNITVKKVTPNYVGIAVVAGGSIYLGHILTTPIGSMGPKLPILSSQIVNTMGFASAISQIPNINNDEKSFIDPIYNIRSKNTYVSQKSIEIKTDLNFNNLIIQ